MIISAQSLTLESIKQVQFASWEEFVANVDAYPLGIRYNGSSRNKESVVSPWSGAPTWENAINRAKFGDPTLTVQLEAHITRLLERMAPAEVPEMYLDVTTDYGWDMGTAITGNPQCGINFHMVEDTAKKQCKLVVGNVGASSVAPAELYYRGALAYVLYTILSRKGYDVSIDLLTVISNNPNKVNISINVLSAGETMDTSVLAYALMSPSVLRRLYFSLIDTLGNDEVFIEFGPQASYGMPSDIPAELAGDITIDRSSQGSLYDSEASYATLLAHAERIITKFEQARA